MISKIKLSVCICIFSLNTSLFSQNIPLLKPYETGITLDFSVDFIEKFNSPEAFTACEKVYKKNEF